MNSFKLTFRSLISNRQYTWINILGLSIGFSLCLLVFALVIEENSYDKSWKNSDHLFRIVTIDSTAGLERQMSRTFVNLSTELKQVFPEIQNEARIESRKYYLKPHASSAHPIGIQVLESEINILDMLSIKVLEGNPKQLVQGKTNLLIGKEFKEKYFKNENVIGKVIQSADPDTDKPSDYIITGVMDNLPYNSTLRASAIALVPKISMELSKDGSGYYTEQFVQLKPGTPRIDLEQKLNHWYKGYLSPNTKHVTSFRLQPIQDIYMEPLGSADISGNQKTTNIFVGVAVLVFIISCINFINIYAVRTVKKLRALHIHKVLGASRAQMIRRMLLETILLFFISALCSLVLFRLGLSQLEHFIGYDLAYIKSIQLPLLLAFMTTAIALGVLIGFYPAWLISGIKSSDALKNKLSKIPNAEVFIKKMLITTQFSIAIIVIIGLITIKSQLSYMQAAPLGMEVKNVLNIDYFNKGTQNTNIKDRIGELTGVESVSVAAWTPTIGSGYLAKTIVDKDDPGKNIQVSFIGGDVDLPKTLGIQLVKGRLLTPEDYTHVEMDMGEDEGINNALVTESTAKKLGINKLGILYKDLQIIPVGIIKDFHSESFRSKIVPTVILAKDFNGSGNILIKVGKGQEQQIFRSVSQIIQNTYPDKHVSFHWIDELIAKQYEKENKQVQLFILFSALTLLISALGITGLIMQNLEQRTKEIGIRKVLGATVFDISRLFSKDYLILSTLAIFIASPIAGYFSKKWLEDYAYNVGVQWWFFILAALAIFLISIITVNFQTIRAALNNPVDSLRNE
ncbi:ABC transporter permease [Sphingobacterium multivorum]|uniref:Macrolide export ATP-binding/permease protein MacB n=1 Tax=Sphingobacterium multivorum TaxID=28454 RepID=A0A2X2L439_SPHMU|nr:ABC transporter permease [Sphingobacterium multivorum]QRQ61845.1 ABC transporter permease [Sphingobacterium multivorum]SPZ84020.1 Macrolide export ATP-binding/permease protein MacB [Sphingobacterium multivorum]